MTYPAVADIPDSLRAEVGPLQGTAERTDIQADTRMEAALSQKSRMPAAGEGEDLRQSDLREVAGRKCEVAAASWPAEGPTRGEQGRESMEARSCPSSRSSSLKNIYWRE